MVNDILSGVKSSLTMYQNAIAEAQDPRIKTNTSTIKKQ